MKIKYLKNEFTEEDLHCIIKDNLLIGITNYQYSHYEGTGYLVALGKDGMRRKYDCGHCSCYGPLENGYTGKFTKEEIYKLMEQTTCDYYYYTELQKKEILEFIIKN